MRKALGKTLMIGAGVGVVVAVLGRDTEPGQFGGQIGHGFSPDPEAVARGCPRSASMARAAALPSATALTTSRPPFTWPAT